MNFTVLKGTFHITTRNPVKTRNKSLMSAGFTCSITLNRPSKLSRLNFSHPPKITSEAMGLTPDYDLTPSLSIPIRVYLILREYFLRLNKVLVDPGKRTWFKDLNEYKAYLVCRLLLEKKNLSYSFYVNVYCN